MNIDKDKLLAIETAMKQIERQFGKGFYYEITQDNIIPITSPISILLTILSSFHFFSKFFNYFAPNYIIKILLYILTLP